MTQPLDAAQVASQIARVEVTDLETGETTELATRPASVCLFFDRFNAGDFLVQLRLDWGDIDANRHPTLDADFLDPVTEKLDRSMRGHPAHHSHAAGSGPRVYEWLFEDVAQHFAVAVAWSASGRVDAFSGTSASVGVVRAPSRGMRHG